MNQEKILDISWATVLKIFVLIALVYIFYQIKDILVWFVFALIISILFEPAIEFFKKFKIPRPIGVLIAYLGVFGVFILIISLTAPLFVSEIQQFSRFLPQHLEGISPFFRGIGVEAFNDIETFVSAMRVTVESATANILNILFIIFGGIFSFIFILSIAIFISLEEKSIEKTLLLLFPRKYDSYLLLLWKRVQKRVTGWFTTKVIACLFVGVATFVSLLIFKAPYPFLFGFLAGIFNFVPIIGPLATGLLLFAVISFNELFKAIFILIVFTVIQQVEGSVVLPLLSKKFIGLSPVLVLLSLAIGGVLWGFLGSILAVPLAAILIDFLSDFIKKKREEEEAILV